MINTGDIFDTELGAAPEEDPREARRERTKNMRNQHLQGIMHRTERRREMREEEEARQAEIEDRAAQFTDMDHESGMTEDNIIASRAAQGARFGPWGAVAGLAAGAGESVVKSFKQDGIKGAFGTVGSILNPFESVPDSIDAIGGQLSGRNASGIDSAALGASNLEVAGRMGQSAFNNYQSSDGSVEAAGGIPEGGYSLDEEFMPEQSTFDNEVHFDSDIGAGDDFEMPTNAPQLDSGAVTDPGIMSDEEFTAWLNRK